MALLLAQIQRDRNALVAVVLDGLHFRQSHRHAVAATLGNVGFRGSGAAGARQVQYPAGDGLQLGRAVGKNLF
ncbi:hypothetical protein D3C72_2085010 [compost metagenome]